MCFSRCRNGKVFSSNIIIIAVLTNIYTHYKIILVVGLIVTKPIPTKFEVSFSSHYWSCEPQGDNKIVFLVLSTVYGAFLLLFATFLAYKTRFAGRQYNRYSECKQMGLSV
jgi:hypothetical protein